MLQNKPDQMVYGLAQVPAVGTQLPQEVSSSILSADGPLHAEDSSPASVHKAAAVPAGQHIAGPGAAGNPAAHVASAAAPGPSPRQGVQLLGSPVKGAAVAAAAAAGSMSSPEGPVGDAKQLPSPSATATEIEDEYEESDLDDDWKALLGGVDARLKLQGARAMNPRERAVAIKKLLVATGTRGVEFALNTTLQVRMIAKGVDQYNLLVACRITTPQLYGVLQISSLFIKQRIYPLPCYVSNTVSYTPTASFLSSAGSAELQAGAWALNSMQGSRLSAVMARSQCCWQGGRCI